MITNTKLKGGSFQRASYPGMQSDYITSKAFVKLEKDMDDDPDPVTDFFTQTMGSLMGKYKPSSKNGNNNENGEDGLSKLADRNLTENVQNFLNNFMTFSSSLVDYESGKFGDGGSIDDELLKLIKFTFREKMNVNDTIEYFYTGIQFLADNLHRYTYLHIFHKMVGSENSKIDIDSFKNSKMKIDGFDFGTELQKIYKIYVNCFNRLSKKIKNIDKINPNTYLTLTNNLQIENLFNKINKRFQYGTASAVANMIGPKGLKKYNERNFKMAVISAIAVRSVQEMATSMKYEYDEKLPSGKIYKEDGRWFDRNYAIPGVAEPELKEFGEHIKFLPPKSIAVGEIKTPYNNVGGIQGRWVPSTTAITAVANNPDTVLHVSADGPINAMPELNPVKTNKLFSYDDWSYTTPRGKMGYLFTKSFYNEELGRKEKDNNFFREITNVLEFPDYVDKLRPSLTDDTEYWYPTLAEYSTMYCASKTNIEPEVSAVQTILNFLLEKFDTDIGNVDDLKSPYEIASTANNLTLNEPYADEYAVVNNTAHGFGDTNKQAKYTEKDRRATMFDILVNLGNQCTQDIKEKEIKATRNIWNGVREIGELKVNDDGQPNGNDRPGQIMRVDKNVFTAGIHQYRIHDQYEIGKFIPDPTYPYIKKNINDMSEADMKNSKEDDKKQKYTYNNVGLWYTGGKVRCCRDLGYTVKDLDGLLEHVQGLHGGMHRTQATLQGIGFINSVDGQDYNNIYDRIHSRFTRVINDMAAAVLNTHIVNATQNIIEDHIIRLLHVQNAHGGNAAIAASIAALMAMPFPFGLGPYPLLSAGDGLINDHDFAITFSFFPNNLAGGNEDNATTQRNRFPINNHSTINNLTPDIFKNENILKIEEALIRGLYNGFDKFNKIIEILSCICFAWDNGYFNEGWAIVDILYHMNVPAGTFINNPVDLPNEIHPELPALPDTSIPETPHNIVNEHNLKLASIAMLEHSVNYLTAKKQAKEMCKLIHKQLETVKENLSRVSSTKKIKTSLEDQKQMAINSVKAGINTWGEFDTVRKDLKTFKGLLDGVVSAKKAIKDFDVAGFDLDGIPAGGNGASTPITTDDPLDWGGVVPPSDVSTNGFAWLHKTIVDDAFYEINKLIETFTEIVDIADNAAQNNIFFTYLLLRERFVTSNVGAFIGPGLVAGGGANTIHQLHVLYSAGAGVGAHAELSTALRAFRGFGGTDGAVSYEISLGPYPAITSPAAIDVRHIATDKFLAMDALILTKEPNILGAANLAAALTYIEPILSAENTGIESILTDMRSRKEEIFLGVQQLHKNIIESSQKFVRYLFGKEINSRNDGDIINSWGQHIIFNNVINNIMYDPAFGNTTVAIENRGFGRRPKKERIFRKLRGYLSPHLYTILLEKIYKKGYVSTPNDFGEGWVFTKRNIFSAEKSTIVEKARYKIMDLGGYTVLEITNTDILSVGDAAEYAAAAAAADAAVDNVIGAGNQLDTEANLVGFANGILLLTADKIAEIGKTAAAEHIVGIVLTAANNANVTNRLIGALYNKALAIEKYDTEVMKLGEKIIQVEDEMTQVANDAGELMGYCFDYMIKAYDFANIGKDNALDIDNFDAMSEQIISKIKEENNNIDYEEIKTNADYEFYVEKLKKEANDKLRKVNYIYTDGLDVEAIVNAMQYKYHVSTILAGIDIVEIGAIAAKIAQTEIKKGMWKQIGTVPNVLAPDADNKFRDAVLKVVKKLRNEICKRKNDLLFKEEKVGNETRELGVKDAGLAITTRRGVNAAGPPVATAINSAVINSPFFITTAQEALMFVDGAADTRVKAIEDFQEADTNEDYKRDANTEIDDVIGFFHNKIFPTAPTPQSVRPIADIKGIREQADIAMNGIYRNAHGIKSGVAGAGKYLESRGNALANGIGTIEDSILIAGVVACLAVNLGTGLEIAAGEAARAFLITEALVQQSIAITNNPGGVHGWVVPPLDIFYQIILIYNVSNLHNEANFGEISRLFHSHHLTSLGDNPPTPANGKHMPKVEYILNGHRHNNQNMNQGMGIIVTNQPCLYTETKPIHTALRNLYPAWVDEYHPYDAGMGPVAFGGNPLPADRPKAMVGLVDAVEAVYYAACANMKAHTMNLGDVGTSIGNLTHQMVSVPGVVSNIVKEKNITVGAKNVFLVIEKIKNEKHNDIYKPLYQNGIIGEILKKTFEQCGDLEMAFEYFFNKMLNSENYKNHSTPLNKQKEFVYFADLILRGVFKLIKENSANGIEKFGEFDIDTLQFPLGIPEIKDGGRTAIIGPDTGAGMLQQFLNNTDIINGREFKDFSKKLQKVLNDTPNYIIEKYLQIFHYSGFENDSENKFLSVIYNRQCIDITKNAKLFSIKDINSGLTYYDRKNNLAALGQIKDKHIIGVSNVVNDSITDIIGTVLTETFKNNSGEINNEKIILLSTRIIEIYNTNVSNFKNIVKNFNNGIINNVAEVTGDERNERTFKELCRIIIDDTGVAESVQQIIHNVGGVVNNFIDKKNVYVAVVVSSAIVAMLMTGNKKIALKAGKMGMAEIKKIIRHAEIMCGEPPGNVAGQSNPPINVNLPAPSGPVVDPSKNIFKIFYKTFLNVAIPNANAQIRRAQLHALTLGGNLAIMNTNPPGVLGRNKFRRIKTNIFNIGNVAVFPISQYYDNINFTINKLAFDVASDAFSEISNTIKNESYTFQKFIKGDDNFSLYTNLYGGDYEKKMKKSFDIDKIINTESFSENIRNGARDIMEYVSGIDFTQAIVDLNGNVDVPGLNLYINGPFVPPNLAPDDTNLFNASQYFNQPYNTYLDKIKTILERYKTFENYQDIADIYNNAINTAINVELNNTLISLAVSISNGLDYLDPAAVQIIYPNHPNKKHSSFNFYFGEKETLLGKDNIDLEIYKNFINYHSNTEVSDYKTFNADKKTFPSMGMIMGKCYQDIEIENNVDFNYADTFLHIFQLFRTFILEFRELDDEEKKDENRKKDKNKYRLLENKKGFVSMVEILKYVSKNEYYFLGFEENVENNFLVLYLFKYLEYIRTYYEFIFIQEVSIRNYKEFELLVSACVKKLYCGFERANKKETAKIIYEFYQRMNLDYYMEEDLEKGKTDLEREENENENNMEQEGGADEIKTLSEQIEELNSNSSTQTDRDSYNTSIENLEKNKKNLEKNKTQLKEQIKEMKKAKAAVKILESKKDAMVKLKVAMKMKVIVVVNKPKGGDGKVAEFEYQLPTVEIMQKELDRIDNQKIEDLPNGFEYKYDYYKGELNPDGNGLFLVDIADPDDDEYVKVADDDVNIDVDTYSKYATSMENNKINKQFMKNNEKELEKVKNKIKEKFEDNGTKMIKQISGDDGQGRIKKVEPDSVKVLNQKVEKVSGTEKSKITFQDLKNSYVIVGSRFKNYENKNEPYAQGELRGEIPQVLEAEFEYHWSKRNVEKDDRKGTVEIKEAGGMQASETLCTAQPVKDFLKKVDGKKQKKANELIDDMRELIKEKLEYTKNFYHDKVNSLLLGLKVLGKMPVDKIDKRVDYLLNIEEQAGYNNDTLVLFRMLGTSLSMLIRNLFYSSSGGLVNKQKEDLINFHKLIDSANTNEWSLNVKEKIKYYIHLLLEINIDKNCKKKMIYNLLTSPSGKDKNIITNLHVLVFHFLNMMFLNIVYRGANILRSEVKDEYEKPPCKNLLNPLINSAKNNAKDETAKKGTIETRIANLKTSIESAKIKIHDLKTKSKMKRYIKLKETETFCTKIFTKIYKHYEKSNTLGLFNINYFLEIKKLNDPISLTKSKNISEFTKQNIFKDILENKKLFCKKLLQILKTFSSSNKSMSETLNERIVKIKTTKYLNIKDFSQQDRKFDKILDEMKPYITKYKLVDILGRSCILYIQKIYDIINKLNSKTRIGSTISKRTNLSKQNNANGGVGESVSDNFYKDRNKFSPITKGSGTGIIVDYSKKYLSDLKRDGSSRIQRSHFSEIVKYSESMSVGGNVKFIPNISNKNEYDFLTERYITNSFYIENLLSKASNSNSNSGGIGNKLFYDIVSERLVKIYDRYNKDQRKEMEANSTNFFKNLSLVLMFRTLTDEAGSKLIKRSDMMKTNISKIMLEKLHATKNDDERKVLLCVKDQADAYLLAMWKRSGLYNPMWGDTGQSGGAGAVAVGGASSYAKLKSNSNIRGQLVKDETKKIKDKCERAKEEYDKCLKSKDGPNDKERLELFRKAKELEISLAREFADIKYKKKYEEKFNEQLKKEIKEAGGDDIDTNYEKTFEKYKKYLENLDEGFMKKLNKKLQEYKGFRQIRSRQRFGNRGNPSRGGGEGEGEKMSKIDMMLAEFEEPVSRFYRNRNV